MKLDKLAVKLGAEEDKILEAILMFDESFVEDNDISKELEKNIEDYLKKESDASETKEDEKEEDIESIGIKKAITVKSFAEIMQVPLVEVMTTLVKNGFMMNLNSVMDFEIAAIIAEEIGKKVHLIEMRDENVSEIDEIDLGVLISEKDKSKLIDRAPVISVVGHVDHGKTSLLDYIRKTNVVSKEAGSITQSIGAYQVVHNKKKITFLDTPGHEAFVAMRRRGVRSTDIAVLVVAADDGVKAQTIEAINHIKEAGVPMIVAINKIDKPGADLNKVKEQLVAHEILLEEWGGKVIGIPVSAKTGEGITDLLESILLVSEMSELKANPDRAAIGTVIESNLDQKLGATATVVVHTGTLKTRDIVVVGEAHGRARSLLNHNKKSVKSIGPSEPVLLTGLNTVPQVGDILKVVSNERMAKIMSENLRQKREQSRSQKESLNLELITRKVKEKKLKGINIILRADTEGSIEAIKNSLSKIKTKNARIRVIRSKTGKVSVSDVNLAQLSEAYLVAFNVDVNVESALKAQDNGIEILKFDIIYKLVEALTAKMLSSIEKEYEKIELGKAEVLKIFLTKKDFMICGINLISGKVTKNCKATVTRKKEEIGDLNISKVQIVAKEVSMVEAPAECGIRIEKRQVMEGDKLAIYKLVEKKIELIK